jgi:hypothetical protein
VRAVAGTAYSAGMDPAPLRDYDPIQPRGTNWGGMLRRLFGPLIAGIFVLAKWGFVLLKFSTIFIAFGGYALIFGWKFAAGFVLLIFAHEMGHFIEAKREGLNPSWPIFVPFILAFVRYTRALRSRARSSEGSPRSRATSLAARTARTCWSHSPMPASCSTSST